MVKHVTRHPTIPFFLPFVFDFRTKYFFVVYYGWLIKGKGKLGKMSHPFSIHVRDDWAVAWKVTLEIKIQVSEKKRFIPSVLHWSFNYAVRMFAVNVIGCFVAQVFNRSRMTSRYTALWQWRVGWYIKNVSVSNECVICKNISSDVLVTFHSLLFVPVRRVPS